EEAAVVLAQWAATAIDNARLYEASERRRDEAERAVRSLEAARDIADAIGGVADLDRVLELIVKRGRALVDAQSLLIMLRDDDERLLRTFAQSAANAVAIKRSVEADRLRSAITAADAERSRWARELHDQTLQALGGLRVLLASAQRRNDALADEPAIRQAIEDIELETDNLRAIITDLRPSLLDDLGLLPAIESLLDRRREAGLEI